MALAGDRGHVLALVDRVQEDVADPSVERVDAVDVHDEADATELAEEARHDERELVARLELALVLDSPLLGPRRQEQRQRDDRDEERRGEPQDRPDHVARPWPEVNQTIISLSRYQRDSVSSTVRNTVTDSRMLK